MRACNLQGRGGSGSRPVGAGSIVLMALEQLRPTQMAVGIRAVTSKRRKLESRAHKRKRIEHLLASRPIPTVRGPGSELYIIDHHHFGLALWQAEVESAYARIVDDMSALAPAAFWRRMEASGRLYPYDEEGRRVPPARLPTWLHALRHDPYRDLAWEVREAGGFRKTAKPYAEFRWANFLRERIKIAAVRRNYEAAVDKAMRLCRSPAAAELPGFIDPHE